MHFQYFCKCPNLRLAFWIFSFPNIVIIVQKYGLAFLTHNLSLHIVVLLLDRWSLHHWLLLLLHPASVVFKYFPKDYWHISSNILKIFLQIFLKYFFQIFWIVDLCIICFSCCIHPSYFFWNFVTEDTTSWQLWKNKYILNTDLFRGSFRIAHLQRFQASFLGGLSFTVSCTLCLCIAPVIVSNNASLCENSTHSPFVAYWHLYEAND